ncbi:MAG: C-type lectin domain-containing protein [Treponema sp.]|nr:C-type lectin domain-containing protein [Treponema sp.]
MPDVSWTQAKTFCESKGGHLATITSTAKQREVFSLIANGQKKLYWIGDQRTGNGWRWVTGEQWGYTNWAWSLPRWVDTKISGRYTRRRGNDGKERRGAAGIPGGDQSRGGGASPEAREAGAPSRGGFGH